MARRWGGWKRLLVGRPIATEHADHQLLPKRLALPVFASDALSSVSYATEEILNVLAIVGVAALITVTPISIAVSVLMIVVVTSYRQTVRAYPRGGGAYNVTKDNLGIPAALVAAAALLIDYTLTVAVSIAAGVSALTSVWAGLVEWRVALGVSLIVLVGAANLRGMKESGTLFAIPTYGFIVAIFTMITIGAVRCVGGCPTAAPIGDEFGIPAAGALGLVLVLRAFASGATALTGVEAISDGVAAFRKPQAENAARTLAVLAVIAVPMFIGISALARVFNVQSNEEYVHETGRTVVSQIAETAFGGRGILFYVVQFATAAILILAANTAFADFPRLASFLAQDRFLPRQFMNRGDRLVFSNGIFVLVVAAGVLLAAFGGEVTRLIQLYVVGVFTSFTLSQTGMVLHWWRGHEDESGVRVRNPGWQWRMTINAVGAVATFVVLVVVVFVKFTKGAWIVIVAAPLVIFTMYAVHRHYEAVRLQLRAKEGRNVPPAAVTHVVVLVAHTGQATRKAINYVDRVDPASVRYLHVDESGDEIFLDNWREIYPERPLELVRPRARLLSTALALEVLRIKKETPEGFLTVVIPELLRNRNWTQFLRRRHGLQIKRALLGIEGVVVTDVPFVIAPRRGTVQDTDSVGLLHCVASVSGVTQPVLQALDYARSLTPDSLHVVHADVTEEQTSRMLRDWEANGLQPPLELLPSAYRGVVAPLRAYVRRLRRTSSRDSIVNVILPEFIVPGFLGKLLHNQTALGVKAAFIFEPRVLVTSVPYHLVSPREARRRHRRFGTVRLPTAVAEEARGEEREQV